MFSQTLDFWEGETGGVLLFTFSVVLICFVLFSLEKQLILFFLSEIHYRQ